MIRWEHCNCTCMYNLVIKKEMKNVQNEISLNFNGSRWMV